MGSPLRQEVHAVPFSPPPAPRTGLVYGRNEPPRSTHNWVLYSCQWAVTMVYCSGLGLRDPGYRPQLCRRENDPLHLCSCSGLREYSAAGHRMAMVHGPNVIPSLEIVAASTAGENHVLQYFPAQALSGGIIVGSRRSGSRSLYRSIPYRPNCKTGAT